VRHRQPGVGVLAQRIDQHGHRGILAAMNFGGSRDL
jgi:hypothetical protein